MKTCVGTTISGAMADEDRDCGARGRELVDAYRWLAAGRPDPEAGAPVRLPAAANQLNRRSNRSRSRVSISSASLSARKRDLSGPARRREYPFGRKPRPSPPPRGDAGPITARWATSSAP